MIRRLRSVLYALRTQTRIFPKGGASFWRAEGGATAIEYALIATLISVAILAALSLFADNMGAMFNTISNAVSSGV